MKIFKTVENSPCHAKRSRSMVFILLLFFASLQIANAQNNGCVDEFAKNPTYQCTFPFQPVCACDGVTYFNQCDAYNHGGIIFNGTNLNNGICGDAAMFLGQDAKDRLVRMFFQFKQGGGNLTFMLIDIYGKVVRQQFIRSSSELPIIIDIETSAFPPGVYIAYAFGGNFRKTIKFAAGTL